ncbi:MAG: ArsR/SmtB family transcription factor, partial [Candidatus Methanofastidiosia archaeon]
SELTSLTNLNQSNLSQHLAILRGKGVVKTRKEKANIYYRIANPKIIEACDLMREVLYEHLSENEKLAKLVLERGDE